jgi:hypothetical protein
MPQTIVITLIAIELLLSLILHGQKTTINFWARLIDALILILLLRWGNFF